MLWLVGCSASKIENGSLTAWSLRLKGWPTVSWESLPLDGDSHCWQAIGWRNTDQRIKQSTRRSTLDWEIASLAGKQAEWLNSGAELGCRSSNAWMSALSKGLWVDGRTSWKLALPIDSKDEADGVLECYVAESDDKVDTLETTMLCLKSGDNVDTLLSVMSQIRQQGRHSHKALRLWWYAGACILEYLVVDSEGSTKWKRDG